MTNLMLEALRKFYLVADKSNGISTPSNVNFWLWRVTKKKRLSIQHMGARYFFQDKTNETRYNLMANKHLFSCLRKVFLTFKVIRTFPMNNFVIWIIKFYGEVETKTTQCRTRCRAAFQADLRLKFNFGLRFFTKKIFANRFDIDATFKALSLIEIQSSERLTQQEELIHSEMFLNV